MTEKHPTIPQIVRALVTLSDRQRDEMQALRDEYNEVIAKKDRTIAEYDRAAVTRDDRIEAQQQVIEDLLDTISTIRQRAERDIARCVDMDAQSMWNTVGAEKRLYDLVKKKLAAIHKARAERLNEGVWKEGELPDDICNCGHIRQRHTPRPGLDWTGHQCDDCPGDEERAWRHPFTLAVL